MLICFALISCVNHDSPKIEVNNCKYQDNCRSVWTCEIIKIETKYLAIFQSRIQIEFEPLDQDLDYLPTICINKENDSFHINVQVNFNGDFKIPLAPGVYCYSISLEGGFRTIEGVVVISPAYKKRKLQIFNLAYC